MLILHAIWSQSSQLLVWGEDSAQAQKQVSFKLPRKSLPLHPFSCDLEWLSAALDHLETTLLFDQLADTELNLWLPSFFEKEQLLPQPSPYLPHSEVTKKNPELRLAAWQVPAIAIQPVDAVDLLVTLPLTAPQGVVIGSSLRFFSEAAKLALELITRGQILPALEQHEDRYFARWQPIIDDDRDQERWRILTSSMPPLCRAEYLDDPTKRKSRQSTKTTTKAADKTVDIAALKTPINTVVPHLLLRNMLGAMVDASVRQLLQERLPREEKKRTRKTKDRRTPAERWLDSLLGAEAKFSGTADEIAKLKKDLDQWHASVHAGHDALRLCFRLTAPQAERGRWQLDFLLQAMEDKSLLIEADQIWQLRQDTIKFLNRTMENPQEKLLAALGRAALLYPPLDRALETACPNSLALDSAGAYKFLQSAVPLLEQSGFGLLMPAWWQRPAQRLGLKLQVSGTSSEPTTAKGLMTAQNLLKYQWEISLGDDKLSFSDLKKLAELKTPLVQRRGEWVAIKKEEIEQALKFFSKHELQGEMSVIEAIRASVGITDDQLGLPVIDIEAQGWFQQLLQTADSQLRQLPAPTNFHGQLRPYQQRGLAWLNFMQQLGLGGCLADDMGLGKTVQLLALLLTDRNGQTKKTKLPPALLICPMSVVGNWQREASRFAPDLKVHVHHGAQRLSGDKFAKTIQDIDLVITTYNLALRDQKFLKPIEWQAIALDEAQNIKSAAAKQTQAINSFTARQRFALTGTPVENRLTELWSIMNFLNRGLLNSASDFRERFALPIERYRDEEKAKLLKRITGPFVLRRLKTDKSIIADLPDKLEMKIFCNLTREQATLYQAIVNEMMEELQKAEGMKRKGLIFSIMMRLKQVCNHPVQLLKDRSELPGRSGKLARLEEILEEALANNDRALCFTQFSEMGELLKDYLQERFAREVLFLHGGTPKRARDEMVARFQAPNGPAIFLLSLKAGGTGLNLTAANQVIHFDRWWNPAVENQATDRAFRIGQQQNVQVRKFICVGTLEEKIDEMIEQKKELADRIVGSGEGWLTELSTQQIRELVTLSADAVAES